MIEEFRLPADFVVRQLDRMCTSWAAGTAARHPVPKACGAPPFWLKPPGRKPCEIGVVHHGVRRDVPGEVAAALEAGLGVAQILRVEIVEIIERDIRRPARPARSSRNCRETLPAEELSKRKWRVPAVAVNTFGIRSKSTEAKNAVCLVSRTVS